MRRGAYSPWTAIAMAAIGCGLLAAAGLARAAQNASPAGGTLRLSKSTDVDYVDPALAYFTDTFGMIGYATCAKLYSYPDLPAPGGAQVIPEVASSFPRVSDRGTVYTIPLRRTYRFHTGAPITAANFVEAFNRDANPKMQSPATRYMKEIAGAEDVILGKAKLVSGVRAASPYVLEIRTTKPVPDLVARLTLPFFCPVRLGEKIDPDGVNNPLGSGPYYVAKRVVNRYLILRRNRFYRGPRPAGVDQVVWTIGPSLESCRLMTEKGETDYCIDGLPPTAYEELARRYGVNRKGGRLFFSPRVAIGYFALNHERPAFKNNVALAKALNYAVDRPSLVRASGYLGGIRTDQILPPALWRDADLYPLGGPDLEKARALVVAHMPPGNKLILYGRNRGGGLLRGQLLQFQLGQIGIELEVRQFYREPPPRCETRGQDFDLCEQDMIVDYADGVTFLDPLLNGRRIQPTRNTNISYFDVPEVNRRIAEISRLAGPARASAWANLDVDVMRRYAPVVPFAVPADRDFVSRRVGCYLHHPVFGIDLVALCLR